MRAFFLSLLLPLNCLLHYKKKDVVHLITLIFETLKRVSICRRKKDGMNRRWIWEAIHGVTEVRILSKFTRPRSLPFVLPYHEVCPPHSSYSLRMKSLYCGAGGGGGVGDGSTAEWLRQKVKEWRYYPASIPSYCVMLGSHAAFFSSLFFQYSLSQDFLSQARWQCFFFSSMSFYPGFFPCFSQGFFFHGLFFPSSRFVSLGSLARS